MIIDIYVFLKGFLGQSRAIEIMRRVMRFLGRIRAPLMARYLGVRPDDMAELAKIQDLEDKLFGVRGYWEERDKHIAKKLEMFCPFAQKLRGNSEFCHILVKEFEEATFRSINSSYSLTIDGKLLSEYGGTGCLFIHKIKVN